jgi:large subunit ribosomal protein L6
MTRALLANMVRGVTRGYSRMLEIVGVGWNAAGRGRELHLNIGFCHPIVFPVPAGLEVETPRPTQIIIRGADKQALGQFAAKVRAIRPPEPYKGKGIRYEGEVVRRKAGKSFGS